MASVPAGRCNHLADTAGIGNRYVPPGPIVSLANGCSMGSRRNGCASSESPGPACDSARRSSCPGPEKSRARSTSMTPVSQPIYPNRRTYFRDVDDYCGEPSWITDLRTKSQNVRRRSTPNGGQKY